MACSIIQRVVSHEKRFLVCCIILLVFGDCGSHNVNPGQMPEPNEGVVFAIFQLEGVDSAFIDMYRVTETGKQPVGSFEMSEGTDVYARFLTPGHYETFGFGVHNALGGDFGTTDFTCPSYEIQAGSSNYIGTYRFNVKAGILKAELPSAISCDVQPGDFEKATQLFNAKFSDLSQKFPVRSAIANL